jgi:hypothetical protein
MDGWRRKMDGWGKGGISFPTSLIEYKRKKKGSKRNGKEGWISQKSKLFIFILVFFFALLVRLYF